MVVVVVENIVVDVHAVTFEYNQGGVECDSLDKCGIFVMDVMEKLPSL